MDSLKKETADLIKKSKEADYQGREDCGDYLDVSVIGDVERINQNPEVATTGSCSGENHTEYPGYQGHVFVAVVFRDEDVAKRYLDKLRGEGFVVEPSDEIRMGWFRKYHPKVKREWNVSIDEGQKPRQAWDKWTQILSRVE